jgi:hypothetical protein
MVLIHPLLHANAHRRRKVHLVVCFIVLAGNAGGALSPLGPPLYIGFLEGVPFFWPLLHLGLPFLLLTALELAGFYLLDWWLARSEPPPAAEGPLRLRGWINVVLVLIVAASVVAQGMLDFGSVTLLGQSVEVTRLAGMLLCLGVTGLSVAVTPRAVHQGNDFTSMTYEPPYAADLVGEPQAMPATDLRTHRPANASAVARPGICNCRARITARPRLQAKAAGFEALYLSGAAMTASMGLPDLGMITVDEVCFFVRQIARATGCRAGGRRHRLRRGAERHAHGAQLRGCRRRAVHIEDQLLPKKCGHLNDKKLADAA